MASGTGVVQGAPQQQRRVGSGRPLKNTDAFPLRASSLHSRASFPLPNRVENGIVQEAVKTESKYNKREHGRIRHKVLAICFGVAVTAFAGGAAANDEN
jgi:hypothetical protein